MNFVERQIDIINGANALTEGECFARAYLILKKNNV